MKKFAFLALTCLLISGLAAFKILPGGYQIGDTAADFNLKNIDGKMVSLGKMSDVKGYIVVFTCNHCPFAVAYEDRIIALHNKYAPLGYPVVAINPNDPSVVPDDSFDAMKKRAADKKFPFVYLFDDGQKIYPQFGATRTPHVYILDKKRVVRYIGGIDDNSDDETAVKSKYVEMAVDALIAGKNPEPSTTKAIGCSIKKKKQG
jgi:peroxiredoxin